LRRYACILLRDQVAAKGMGKACGGCQKLLRGK